MKTSALRSTDRETVNVLGLPHRILVEGADNPAGYEFVEITGEPGAGVPPHVHADEDETFYVVSGRAGFQFGETQFEAAAGDAVNLPRGIPHAFTILEAGTRLALTIAPGTLAPMFRELAALPPGPPDLAVVSEICGRFNIRFV